MKRMLMVAMHVPPMYGSGVQRLVALQRDLRFFGWQTDVLTICKCALPDRSADRIQDMDNETRVLRAPGFDSARHFSIAGRYPQLLALPDRWVSWRPAAVVCGLIQTRRLRYDGVFSSFPIATAHLVAADLARFTDLPWIADFRDPMAQDEYPSNPAVWHSIKKVEERVFANASAMTFTTPSAIDYYLARYGDGVSSRCHLLPNGYDEAIFDEIDAAGVESAPRPQELIALHSGILYPWERDPRPFFQAVARLKTQGFWREFPTRFRFRAAGFEADYEKMVDELGIGDLVKFESRVPYRDAVGEMLAADLLLVFQAANSNFQIPAKVYEYLRAGKSILAIVDTRGDTADLLRGQEGAYLAPIESETAQTAVLKQLIPKVFRTRGERISRPSVEKFSRRRSAQTLAAMLDSVTGYHS